MAQEVIALPAIYLCDIVVLHTKNGLSYMDRKLKISTICWTRG
jgi:hypothetical protein